MTSEERRRLFYEAYGMATALLWLLHLNLCCIIFGVIEEWVPESEVYFFSCIFSSFALFVVSVKSRPQCVRESWKDWKICY